MAIKLIDTAGQVIGTIEPGQQLPDCVICISSQLRANGVPRRLRVFHRGDSNEYNEKTFLLLRQ